MTKMTLRRSERRSIYWTACFLAATMPAFAAGDVRDDGGMFSEKAVEQARAEIARIERDTGVPIVIETVPSLKEVTTEEEKRKWRGTKKGAEVLEILAERRDREQGAKGVYMLMSKKDHLLSNLLIPMRLENRLPASKRKEIRQTLLSEFKKANFDGGLQRAVELIGEALKTNPGRGATFPPGQVPKTNPRGGVPENAKGSGMSTIIMIGLLILAVVVGLRLLSGLFGMLRGGGGYGGAPGPGMGGGMGPGMGGGYGGPGYGGRPAGGGFMSSLFGGLGGALFGNYLYDQMSGRSHHNSGGGFFGGNQNDDPGSSPLSPGGDQIVGGDDNGGQASSWGDPGAGGADWAGGGDGGGGDWGGGDGGGGGDW